MREMFLKLLLCVYAVVLIIILSNSMSFGQDTKTPFATTPSPLANRYAYSNNGLWIDSAVKLVYYKQTSDSTLLGVDMSGKLYKVTKSMIGNWVAGVSGGSGSVTSVGLAMPSAFSVTGAPVTGSGTLTVTGNGTSGQYITGTGALATFPTPVTLYSSNGTLTNDRTINGGGNFLSFHGLNNFNVATGGGSFQLTDQGDFSLSTVRPGAGPLDLMTISNDGNYSFNSYDNGSSSLQRLQITGGDDTANLTVSNAHLQFSPGTVNNNSSGKYKILVQDTVTGYVERIVPGATGTVTNVSGTTPIHVANSTATPVISIDNSSADGITKGAASFTASDFNSSAGLISVDYANAQAATTSQKGFLTSADWNTFNSKQGALTLTTTGTSGASTLVGNVLNVPQYSSGGGVTSVGTFNTTSTTNGIDISGGSITLHAADVTNPGALTATAQTIGGAKTFATGITNLKVGAVAATVYDGETLINTTAASSGSQMYSPATHWIGQGWKTTAAAASQSIDFRAYVIPRQGTIAPKGNLTFGVNVNNTGWIDNILNINSANQVLIGSDSMVSSSDFPNFQIAIGTGSFIQFAREQFNNEPCIKMHSGDFGTDNKIVSMYGLELSSSNSNYSGLLIGNWGVGYASQYGSSLPAKLSINGSLYFNGGLQVGYTSKTTNYTLTASDHVINCISNSFTITLPSAVGIVGREYIVKNTGSATTISIATTSSQTIDGTAPGTVTGLTPLRVVSDGANWITW
jgi:hypothetical protein